MAGCGEVVAGALALLSQNIEPIRLVASQTTSVARAVSGPVVGVGPAPSRCSARP